MPLPPLNADLSSKLAVVTGASSGIGKEIAKGLAAQGADLVLPCRNLVKGEGVAQEIAALHPKAKVSIMPLDLASLASTRAFAAAFNAQYQGLDILVNNAGSWSTQHELSADGIELIWAANVLAPHVLTKLLLPALKAKGQARIVNLVSLDSGKLDLEDVEYKKRPFKGAAAYFAAKQADRMLTWGLAGRLAGSGVTANAANPGLIKTELNRNVKGLLALVFGIMVPLIGKSPAMGADTPLWLASSPEAQGLSGKYFEGRKEKACKFQQDKEAIRRLEELCDRMTA